MKSPACHSSALQEAVVIFMEVGLFHSDSQLVPAAPVVMWPLEATCCRVDASRQAKRNVVPRVVSMRVLGLASVGAIEYPQASTKVCSQRALLCLGSLRWHAEPRPSRLESAWCPRRSGLRPRAGRSQLIFAHCLRLPDLLLQGFRRLNCLLRRLLDSKSLWAGRNVFSCQFCDARRLEKVVNKNLPL